MIVKYCIKKLSSPETLNVHIFALLLTQEMFYEVFSLSCLAGEHDMPHGVRSGAVAPRQRPVRTVKPRRQTPERLYLSIISNRTISDRLA